MAELANDTGTLRFAIEIAGRAAPPPGPAGGELDALLAATGVQYHDRRDGEWWPLVRLPAVHLSRAALERFARDLAELVRGGAPGFAWRPSGVDAQLGVQLSAVPGGATVEVGLDLGAFLAEAAGAPRRPDAELVLFRFRSAQAELVRFSDALARELEGLGA